MVALLPSVALLLAILLGPGGLALWLDRQPGKPVARAVLLYSAAACIAPVRALWSGGNATETAIALLGDVSVVGTAWSAAAAGWILVEVAPIATHLVLEARSRARTARLRAARSRLAAEWGIDELS